MPAIRLILILALLTTFFGCSSDDREIKKANQTISSLQAEVRELQIQNAKLQRHEEMRIGEIAFSQGCRFLVNTCFGLDEIGAGLVQEGLSAHGSGQFMAWMVFKLVVLPIILFMLIGGAQVIMNTWVLPSAQKREKAKEVIKEAATVQQKMAREKAASLAVNHTIKADLAQREAKIAARRRCVWHYVQFKKSEVKELKEVITTLQQQVEVLELAKAAAQAFSGRKR
jgi:hypothetical protein